MKLRALALYCVTFLTLETHYTYSAFPPDPLDLDCLLFLGQKQNHAGKQEAKRVSNARRGFFETSVSNSNDRVGQSVDLSTEEVLKPHEAKRVQDAFRLIHKPRQSTLSRADERRDKYRHFLIQLDDEELVVAGALSLGQTAIRNMKESQKLRLPVRLKQRKKDFGSSFLKSLTLAYSSKGQLFRLHGRTRT